MKLSEIIEHLDKSKTNEDYLDLECLANELEIYDFLNTHETDKIKVYWIANHYCTDTFVGLRAYFIDDKLFAVSNQDGRKSDEKFCWISADSREFVKNYIRSLVEVEQGNFSLLNMEEDLGEFYPIYYAGQFIKKNVVYGNKPATIKKELQYVFDEPSVMIECEGIELWVYPRDIQTPFNLKS